MTDPIQAAVEKAEEAVAELENAYHEGFSTIYLRQNLHAAIRSLAALVREYGHVEQCGCHQSPAESKAVAWRCMVDHHEHPWKDPRCLPESREESEK